jgi:hypothetical protein
VWTLVGVLGVAGAIVVAAVAAGSSGDDRATPAAPTSTVAAPTTVADVPLITTTTSAAASAPAVPTTGASVDLSQVFREISPVATTAPHGAYLDGAAGVELFLLDDDGTLRRVDLGTGESRVVANDFSVDTRDVRSIVVGDRLVLASSSDLRTISIVDGTTSMEDPGVTAPVTPVCNWAPGDAPDRLWVLPCFGTNGSDGVVEYSLADHAESDRRTFPVGVDRVADRIAGTGFLVQAGGGVYVVGDDGSRTRLATGRIVATSGRYAALQECDEALRCTPVVLDLTTLERRPLLVGAGVDVRTVYPTNFLASPSRDRSLVIFFFGDGPRAALFDGPAGTLERVAPEAGFDDLSRLAWSGDGAWLFFDARLTLWAWHVGDGPPVQIPGLNGDRLLGARG